jgi:hypothetical protein
MAVLSLLEAAELVRTSKVDVWRAVRSGLLTAQRNADGDYTIDSNELFRVFETRPPEPQPAEDREATTLEPTVEIAAPDEMTVAFSALGTELRTLLAQGRGSCSRGLEHDPGE